MALSRRSSVGGRFHFRPTCNRLWIQRIHSHELWCQAEARKVFTPKRLILPTLLYGCEAWSLRENPFKRLRSFHNKCACSMYRWNSHHIFRQHITSNSLFCRLGLLNIDSYLYNRFLRWAGHVARMPISRAPRQLLASWVAHSRPVGCPHSTWGRALENALKRKSYSKEFDELFAIAKDWSKWRQQTHSNPKPPDA